MFRGADTTLHGGDDVVPFLAMYLIQLPEQLLLELWACTPWMKLDFCTGKVIKESGD